MCELFDNKEAHTWKSSSCSVSADNISIWSFKTPDIAHQLWTYQSDRSRKTDTSDHYDGFARLRNGIQAMHSHSHIHIESVPYHINVASVFTRFQAIQVDDCCIPYSRQLFKWTIASIFVSWAWFEKNHFWVTYILCATRNDVCNTYLFATIRRWFFSVSLLLTYILLFKLKRTFLNFKLQVRIRQRS